MKANKVVLNGKVILDLTADTVTDPDVRLGKIYHKANGEGSVGTATISTDQIISEWDGSYTITGGDE